MHGNVFQWVEDCHKVSYSDAPADASAVASNDCSPRVVRGGSCASYPEDLRSAYRYTFPSDFRTLTNGFRVGRTLSP
jgi:formylglycine-generating enzyme required for sulfatase activity